MFVSSVDVETSARVMFVLVLRFGCRLMPKFPAGSYQVEQAQLSTSELGSRLFRQSIQ